MNEKICECGVEVIAVYARGKGIFERLEDKYYCPECDKILRIRMEEI